MLMILPLLASFWILTLFAGSYPFLFSHAFPFLAGLGFRGFRLYCDIVTPGSISRKALSGQFFSHKIAREFLRRANGNDL